MKITVINGTEKHGVTYRMKEIFLEPFKDRAEITEFYLPRDCPDFCIGCTVCFLNDEHRCKDAQYVQRIEKALLGADLLVFTSPAYVFHATGAMKVMLDHFGYRWMPHRPAEEMFGKRAVIITQCLGAGASLAAKDMKHSLKWWGVSSVKTLKFRLMSDIKWERIPEKKRASFETKLRKTARKYSDLDNKGPARTGISTKLKFSAVKMMQKKLGKEDPEYTDFKYWRSKGWLDGVKPWKRSGA
ncbi:MAG: flavodoxin family protein [Lachnospiraceae bacterium]|nr:flavodoxin family protein [Lachnospiraceae bacterium]